MKQPDEAFAEFERAATLNPSFVDYRFSHILTFAGEPDRALRVERDCVHLDPFYGSTLPVIRDIALFLLRRFIQVVTTGGAVWRQPGKGEAFEDCFMTSKGARVCVPMAVLPKGRFLMGSPKNEIDRLIKDYPQADAKWYRAETPEREVEMPRAFAVATSHVTRGQFAAFVAAKDHKMEGGCWVYDGKEWKQLSDRDWRAPGFDQNDDHPVVCVNWNDAAAFAAWMKELSILDDVSRLKGLMPFIGNVPLDKLHMGSLQAWIALKQREKRAVGTVNHGLQLVRRILNVASAEWIDEQGLTWLHAPPKIKLLPNVSKRPPYPLSWDEQTRLFQELPRHLADMALFTVNTGCRDAEVCGLRWEWEVKVAELGTSVFIVPGSIVKNGDERLVVLNRIAGSVVAAQRGKHPTHVFTYNGAPVLRILNTAWKRARVAVGLPRVRVHDLKHTFGRRLRAAGVSFEDRQDLLGHRSGRITTHYSAAELSRLIEAAETVVDRNGKRPELVVLRGALQGPSRKTPASVEDASGEIFLSL